MITKTFAYHLPGPTAKEQATELRRAYSALEETIKSTGPSSRLQALALTALEESAMWAIKAVVTGDVLTKVEVEADQMADPV